MFIPLPDQTPIQSVRRTPRMPIIARLGFAVMLTYCLPLDPSAQAQTPSGRSIDANVQPASVHRVTAPAAPRTVRFSLRAPLAGDQIEQSISQETQLTTYWRQGNEIANTTTSSGKSSTRRTVTALNVRDGRTVAVEVKYFDATSERASSDRPAQPDAETKLPVMGKTYRCERQGEELIVVDEQGGTPPQEELAIVRDDLESVGRPNPLAEILGGNEVTTGQTISVRPETARRLMGLSGNYGEVVRFDLLFQEVRVEDGVECGIFRASIEAASHDSSQLRLLLSGPLVVQLDTCRAVQMNLAGSVAMSESRGSYSASYQLTSTGRLMMNLASTYRDKAR